VARGIGARALDLARVDGDAGDAEAKPAGKHQTAGGGPAAVQLLTLFPVTVTLALERAHEQQGADPERDHARRPQTGGEQPLVVMPLGRLRVPLQHLGVRELVP
jgi:hypothetical protein